MRFVRRSIVGKLVVCTVLVTAAATAGLWYLLRSIHDDVAALATSASDVHRNALQGADQQATGLVLQARRSSGLVDGVRELQVHFQLQVLAFKNLILRGERPDQKELFIQSFEQQRKEVDAALTDLHQQIGQDAAAGPRLQRFAEAHAKLTASYRNAWAMIDLAESWTEGMHRADDYMVGRDAEPILLLDDLTKTLLGSADGWLAEVQQTGEAAMLATRQAGEAAMATAITQADARNRRIGVYSLAGLVVGSAALLILASRRLRPVREAAVALDRLASGDLKARLAVRSVDEFGRLAQSYNRSVEALATTLGSTRVDWNSFASTRREAAVRLGADLVRTTSELAQAGGSGAESAAAVDERARRLAGRVREIGQELDHTAAGVEELTASLAAVAANAQQADSAVLKTRDLAETAGRSLAEFQAAAIRVGEVVSLIGKIAQQVNLLALNATIESARAGEHGLGFTVVAHEVKALARRTAESTSDIASRVAVMQGLADRTAHEVRSIQELMREATTVVREVSSAVEQQATTTRDMAQTISRAASDGRDLQGVADDLAGIANRSTAAAEVTREAATVLERLTTDLRSALGAAA